MTEKCWRQSLIRLSFSSGIASVMALAGSFVSQLTGGYEWTVVRDGPAEFNRYHWRPSGRFRVRLEPRA